MNARPRSPLRLPLAAALALWAAALLGSCDRGGPSDPGRPDPCLADATHCMTDTTGADTTGADTTSHPPAARDCAADPVVFTEYLIDPSLVKALAQIGSIGGANTEIVGRSYVFPKDGQAGRRLLLRAPTSMRLVGSKHYRPDGADTVPGYVPDWSLYFSAECGVHLELYHIKDVSSRIKAASDTVIYPSSNWELVQDTVRLAAGDTLGWYVPGAPGGLAAFDFIVKNDSVTNRFANQARYVARNSNILHTVCPYDLFEPAKKSAYYALLGSVTGAPVPGADCGTVERDAAGTPAGEWFFDSTFVEGPGVLKKEGYYGDPLPIIVAPDSTVMFGHLGPTDDVRIFRDNPTWVRPDRITTSHCYQAYPNPTTPSGWIWLRMAHAARMDVAYSPTGNCPVAFPDSGFKAYYR